MACCTKCWIPCCSSCNVVCPLERYREWKRMRMMKKELSMSIERLWANKIINNKVTLCILWMDVCVLNISHYIVLNVDSLAISLYWRWSATSVGSGNQANTNTDYHSDFKSQTLETVYKVNRIDLLRVISSHLWKLHLMINTYSVWILITDACRLDYRQHWNCTTHIT